VTPETLGAIKVARYEQLPPVYSPCADCPYRLCNRNADHPLDFHNPTRLEALWTGETVEHEGERYNYGNREGLRDGAQLVCHKTIPTVEHPELQPRHCTGMLAVQQRELLKAHEAGWTRYLATVPRGLSRHGLTRVLSRMLGRVSLLSDMRDLTTSELRAHANPAVDDLAIGYDLPKGDGVSDS
jgi:hypothetical protein